MNIESLDHLTMDYNLGELHHSQLNKKAIQVKLLFWIKDTNPSQPFSLVSIKIPKNLPVYRVRNFVTEMENKLAFLYGWAKRANIVLQTDDQEEKWEPKEQLPLYNVQYI